jgi:predicted anti-sigma-YlaC factor YlaD
MSDELHLGDAQVDDYADGTLDRVTRASVERHLASCERCRAAVDDSRTVVTWARQERPAVTAPAALWPLVASSTIHLGVVRRQVIASMRGVLLAGAIALVAATAMVTWKVARWTSEPRVVASPVPRGGVHAPGGSHPRIPEAPRAPEPPRPR